MRRKPGCALSLAIENPTGIMVRTPFVLPSSATGRSHLGNPGYTLKRVLRGRFNMWRAFLAPILLLSAVSFAHAQESKPDASNVGEYIGYAIGCGCLEHDEQTVKKYLPVLFSQYSDREIKRMRGYLSSGVQGSRVWDNRRNICANVCKRKEFLMSIDIHLEKLETLIARIAPVPEPQAGDLAAFDGKWVGDGPAKSGSRCPSSRFRVELEISNGKINGIVRSRTHPFLHGDGGLFGSVDGVGNLVASGGSEGFELRGSLMATPGEGSGQWTEAGNCTGTFKIGRVQ